MDMADAINIMLYSEQDPDGQPGCAAWDIYPAEASEQIRQFLREKNPKVSLDPIHSQQFYLDEAMKKELLAKDVLGWRIYQEPGDAVFIPAGCAHQVSRTRYSGINPMTTCPRRCATGPTVSRLRRTSLAPRTSLAATPSPRSFGKKTRGRHGRKTYSNSNRRSSTLGARRWRDWRRWLPRTPPFSQGQTSTRLRACMRPRCPHSLTLP